MADDANVAWPDAVLSTAAKFAEYVHPPTDKSTGMMFGDDLMKMAKPLSKPKAVSSVMNMTGSLFCGANVNPFALMTAQQNAQQGEQQGEKQGEKQGPGNFLV